MDNNNLRSNRARDIFTTFGLILLFTVLVTFAKTAGQPQLGHILGGAGVVVTIGFIVLTWRSYLREAKKHPRR